MSAHCFSFWGFPRLSPGLCPKLHWWNSAPRLRGLRLQIKIPGAATTVKTYKTKPIHKWIFWTAAKPNKALKLMQQPCCGRICSNKGKTALSLLAFAPSVNSTAKSSIIFTRSTEQLGNYAAGHTHTHTRTHTQTKNQSNRVTENDRHEQ